MKRALRFFWVSLLITPLLFSYSYAQQQTVGLFQNDPGTFEGYTLFSCIYCTGVNLIDNCGQKVHSWADDITLSNSAYLQEDGSLILNYDMGNADPSIRIGGSGEGIMKMDWDSNVLWDFKYNGPEYRLHHDIAVMPNGNILSLVFENYDYDDCIQAGRDPDKLPANRIWPEKIVEIEPVGATSGNIVWEWKIWDHLIQDIDPSKDNHGIVGDHPELLDINFINYDVAVPGEADWLHFNSIVYNEELDQIMVSCQRLSEIYVIDHSTTTAEAATHFGGRYGKGGDFLYRWGNPQAYRQGGTGDQQLFRQHDAQWIPENYLDGGKIMIFNNGDFRDSIFSEVIIIDPPMDNDGNYLLTPGEPYAPADQEWAYTSPVKRDFFSVFVSGANRLPNGNTLIAEGQDGRIFEVDAKKDIVWEYISPMYGDGYIVQGEEVPWNGWTHNNAIFRAYRFAPDFPAFGGKELSTLGTLEQDPWPYECTTGRKFPISMIVYPSIATTEVNVDFQNIFGNDGRMRVFDSQGKLIWSLDSPQQLNTIDVSDWLPGVYILRVGDKLYRRFVVTK